MVWSVVVACTRGARVLEQWSEDDMAGVEDSCVAVTSAQEIFDAVASLEDGAQASLCISSDALECGSTVAVCLRCGICIAPAEFTSKATTPITRVPSSQ